MPDPRLYLQSVAASAIVGVTCVLAMAARGRPASGTGLNSACVLGMILGLASGYGVLGWQWIWPPMNGLDRLLTIVMPATLGIELVAGSLSVPRRVVWILRASLAATIPRILLHGSVYLNGSGNPWTGWPLAAGLLAGGVLLAGCWWLLLSLSQRSVGVSIPLALGLAIQCAGLTVMLAGYLKGGVAAFPLASTILATAIGAWLVTRYAGTSSHFNSPAILGIGVVGLFGLLFIGRFFGRISTGSALAIFLAPLLCWVTEFPVLRRQKPGIVGSVRLILVVIPLVVVLSLAKEEFDRNMAPLLQHDPGGHRNAAHPPGVGVMERSASPLFFDSSPIAFGLGRSFTYSRAFLRNLARRRNIPSLVHLVRRFRLLGIRSHWMSPVGRIGLRGIPSVAEIQSRPRNCCLRVPGASLRIKMPVV